MARTPFMRNRSSPRTWMRLPSQWFTCASHTNLLRDSTAAQHQVSFVQPYTLRPSETQPGAVLLEITDRPPRIVRGQLMCMGFLLLP